MGTEKIKAIAEGMGVYARIDLDDDVLIYKEGGKGKYKFSYQDKFNPYESDADAFKVLEWLTRQYVNPEISYYCEEGSEYICNIIKSNGEECGYISTNLNEAISNAAYNLIKGE